MKGLRRGSVSIGDIEKIVNEVKNPEVAAFIAFNTLSRAGAQGLPVHKTALNRLAAGSSSKATYSAFVNAIEGQIAQQRSSEIIQVGMPAPDISLPSPDGTQYALSDLKGEVVLLDFWASWCGPCRRENPNVVKVYNKYKDEGFTIYSVSLDGLDSRRTAGLNAEQIAQGNEAQKKRWTDAIAKDNLIWPYHVSELKKWQSQAGQLYGVRGIPKTFLIDREGNIAAVGLRGARSIEDALQKVI
jgi:peroxiredoxin